MICHREPLSCAPPRFEIKQKLKTEKKKVKEEKKKKKQEEEQEKKKLSQVTDTQVVSGPASRLLAEIQRSHFYLFIYFEEVFFLVKNKSLEMYDNGILCPSAGLLLGDVP